LARNLALRGYSWRNFAIFSCFVILAFSFSLSWPFFG
jgi:hypothetical protein